MTNIIKPKIAFFDFAGCEGCQLTAIDALQTHPELLETVEIVQFREAISEQGDDYQIAFIEGGITRSSDEHRLKTIREHAQIVIAFGACAHLGGVNALRNWQPHEEAERYVYGQMGRFQHTDLARPIESVIPIDAFIPGCPIDRNEFISSVRYLLQGRSPDIPDYPVCVECRLNEVPCLFLKGMLCIGPITRAGCNSICPSFGKSCVGCRGQISTANLEGLKYATREWGYDSENLLEKLKIFQSHKMIQGEI